MVTELKERLSPQLSIFEWIQYQETSQLEFGIEKTDYGACVYVPHSGVGHVEVNYRFLVDDQLLSQHLQRIGYKVDDDFFLGAMAVANNAHSEAKPRNNGYDFRKSHINGTALFMAEFMYHKYGYHLTKNELAAVLLHDAAEDTGIDSLVNVFPTMNEVPVEVILDGLDKVVLLKNVFGNEVADIVGRLTKPSKEYFASDHYHLKNPAGFYFWETLSPEIKDIARNIVYFGQFVKNDGTWDLSSVRIKFFDRLNNVLADWSQLDEISKFSKIGSYMRETHFFLKHLFVPALGEEFCEVMVGVVGEVERRIGESEMMSKS